jgi:hypothetical protein
MLQQEPLSGSTAMQVAHTLDTGPRITLFEQVQGQKSSLLHCTKQCLMNTDCIAIYFDQGECELALD